MIYPLGSRYRDQERRARRRRLALGAVVLASLYFLSGSAAAAGLTSGVSRIFRPVWLAGERVALWWPAAGGFFSSKAKLAVENDQLRKNQTALENLRQTVANLTAENDRLREILGRQENRRPPTAAKVLTKPNRLPYDLLVVDVGENNQTKELKLGDLVMANGALVGELVEIGRVTSKVRLYSSPGVTLPIRLGLARWQATTTGRGGGNFILELPRSLDINEGDQVVTGETRDYLVGVVGQVIKNPSEPFQKIRLRLPLNLYEIDWVEIYPRTS